MQCLILERARTACNMTGGLFGVQVGMRNIDSLNGKGEVCEELRRMMRMNVTRVLHGKIMMCVKYMV